MMRDLPLKVTGDVKNPQSFAIWFKDSPSNVTALGDDITNDTSEPLCSGDWIVLLFEGYSGKDLIYANELYSITAHYTAVNFGFKAMMDVRQIKDFSPALSAFKTGPILLGKKTGSPFQILSSDHLMKETLMNTISGFIETTE